AASGADGRAEYWLVVTLRGVGERCLQMNEVSVSEDGERLAIRLERIVAARVVAGHSNTVEGAKEGGGRAVEPPHDRPGGGLQMDGELGGVSPPGGWGAQWVRVGGDDRRWRRLVAGDGSRRQRDGSCPRQTHGRSDGVCREVGSEKLGPSDSPEQMPSLVA